MSRELTIFLSHKKGDSERNARRLAGDIALFAGNSVKVICSANFDPGQNWQTKIRDGLTKANWLILLYTGPHTEWDWCLFETGFFGALMEREPDRRLICLHDPNQSVPAPLRGFVSMPANEDSVTRLFEEIYQNDPWRISPNIFRDNLPAVQDAVRRVCAACRLGSGPTYNIHIAPLINLRMRKNTAEQLEKGVIPPDVPVTGEGVWEPVFGKPVATAGWTWGELTNGILGVSSWEFQLASIMVEAIKRRSVRYPSIAVRISISGSEDRGEVYRIGLRRVAEYDDDLEFVFVLNRIQTPYRTSESDRETMLYHLFNLAWHFRRRFIEFHKREMQRLVGGRETAPEGGRQRDFNLQLADAVQAIRMDLKALEADFQVRGLDRSTEMREAFDEARRKDFDRFLTVEWPPLMRQLNAAIENPAPEPRNIAQILDNMAPINLWFCQNTVELLNGIAHGNQ